MAFELGTNWKVGFTTGLGRPPRVRTIPARDLTALQRKIAGAKRRFGVSETGRVVTCYEAGRDGFWLHRYLRSQWIENYVVDSSSIEVNRRKRRRKSDRLDLRGLLRLMVRYLAGEDDVWSVVNVPTREAEDRRHLHREVETMVEERTERTNRIGVCWDPGAPAEADERLPAGLNEVRLWDDSPLPPELRARLQREWVRR